MDTYGEYLGGERHEAFALDALRQLRPRLDGRYLVDWTDGRWAVLDVWTDGRWTVKIVDGRFR